MQNKEINLYLEYNRKKRSERISGENKHGIAACILLVAVTASAVGGSAFLMQKKSALSNELEMLNKEAGSAKITEGLEYYGKLASENERLSEKYEIISEQTAPLAEQNRYGGFRSDLFLRLQSLCEGKVVLTDISTKDMEFRLSFSARNASEISAFVERLRSDGLFDDVQYSGYEKSAESYRFALVCCLSEVKYE